MNETSIFVNSAAKEVESCKLTTLNLGLISLNCVMKSAMVELFVWLVIKKRTRMFSSGDVAWKISFLH